ncbi:MAG: hypothetical protein H0W61_00945 [Bacteroidetes bacterium]|nr:hypothetical protein [Bacteroidota bacterium]
MKTIIVTVCFFSCLIIKSQSLPYAWAGSFKAACYEPQLITDPQGNTYITGTFQSTIDLDPGPGTYTFSPLNGLDVFICKLNSAGQFVWGKRLTCPSGVQPAAITLDNQSNILITGWFQYIMDFDPGPAVFTLTASFSKDIFVLKLDSSGTFVWARNMGGNGDDEGTVIASDNNGNVYTTGVF